MTIHTLDSLPPRPPTPPRESSHDPMGDVPLKPMLARPPLDPRLSLQTPPNGVLSPNSTTIHSNGSSRRSGKNVAFASLTEYKDAPQYGAENRDSPPSGPLIPSAKASKPPKGILKPFSSPNPLELSFNTANGAVCRRSLVDMLESSLRQLAGDDRADKVDAYGTLSSALKASNNLPDRVALQDRMPRFMGFIQRDITTTPFDAPLANHALTFLSTILFFTGVSSSLTSDFGIFMIDHCIHSFGDSTVPKDVTRHLLQVVAQQNFSPRVMTLDRVTRLLTALHNIENHVTGKSIIHSRIVIYRRLMKQCRPAMLAHTGWLEDLITDTISTTKDIRSVAITFGFEASSSIGKDRQISRKLAELFRSPEEERNPEDNQPSESKREYIDLYIERLKGMLRSRQDPSSVPRIWSVVLLLLRGIQLDKWQSLNPWLRIIQQCFNTSDMQTRREANYAWNRFVYVLYLEEASFSKLLGSTLCSPVCSQWKRKANAAKNDDEFQTAIFGSACNLVYYMFKPGVSHVQLDKYWDKGFKQIMQQLCAPDQGDERYDQAICIFTNLFDTTTRRQWVEDRVLQNPVADASELPPLDPRWLRRNASRVFQLVQPILERKFSDLADGSTPVSKMWKALMTSVSSAASKEIKVSFETTEFISHLFTSLLTLWKRGVQPAVEGGDEEKQRRAFLASTREFVTAVVSAFGILPFTEKQLCSREDVFTPVTTPSHRPAKATGVVLTPLHHLFSLLSSLPEGVQDDEAFSDFFEAIFNPFFRAKNPKASSDLAQEMINSIPLDTVCPYGPWVMAAGTVKAALAQGQSRYKSATLGLPSSNEVPVGREYRDLCKMLERGFKSTPNLPGDHWFAFFGAFENHVGEETGDAGRALAVVEPLAKMILEHITVPSEGFTTQAVLAASALLLISKQPADRQTVDAARRRLWGTTIAKSPTFDPFDNLYKLSNFLMEYMYENLGSPEIANLATSFMEDLETFLAGCNSSLVVRTISILQDGLVYWIKDDESRLSSRQAAETASAAKQVWDRICQIISAQESPAAINLESVERLFCAAFQSKHRHVVNSMAVLWNRVFGDSEEVAYPDELKATLIAIRSMVDIVLPGVGESSQESAAAGQHAFIGSQDDMDVLNISPIKSSRSDRLRLVSSGSSMAPTPISIQSDDTKPRAPPTSDKKHTKPKLRHDDSQLQFEHIETASSCEQESQVLTDRQMEVRERQRDQDALYNMRSSSPVREDGPQAGDLPPSPQLPPASDETPKKRTPSMQTTYDYVNSTPTPRRGQMLPLVQDVEMSDPPSSPPEFAQVRRYPLVPEIRSRSVDEDINWEYTSSPVSGSPLPSRVLPPPEDDREKEPIQGSAEPTAVEDNAEDDTDDVPIADSFALEVVPSSAPAEHEAEEPNKAAEPKDLNSTPTRRQTRQSTRASSRPAPSTPQQGPDSPKLANEEFVDAPTSPKGGAAKQSQKPQPSFSRQSKGTSLALSDGEQQGMIQLADELEAKHKQSRSKRSPKARQDKASEAKAPVLDCITVVAADDDEEEQTPRRKGERVIPSTPHVETPSEQGSRRSTSGGRKRKRESGSRQHETRPKRQRSGSRAGDNDSTTSSPSLRRRKRMQSQEEEEVQSQVISEHMAASSQSRLSPELGEEVSFSQDVEIGDDAGAASAPKTRSSRTSRSSSGSSNSPIRKRPAHKVERHLKKALERVQTATISREEMYRIEDLFVDFKRELYEAERRGRQE